MNCPECESGTKVLETRTYKDPEGDFFYSQRRRECLECSCRFSTVEVAREVWLSVQNREEA